jgi:hypothetical protein
MLGLYAVSLSTNVNKASAYSTKLTNGGAIGAINTLGNGSKSLNQANES